MIFMEIPDPALEILRRLAREHGASISLNPCPPTEGPVLSLDEREEVLRIPELNCKIKVWFESSVIGEGGVYARPIRAALLDTLALVVEAMERNAESSRRESRRARIPERKAHLSKFASAIAKKAELVRGELDTLRLVWPAPPPPAPALVVDEISEVYL